MTIDSGDSNRGRVCVVGCGHVGATSAYALLTRGVAREVVLRASADLLRRTMDGVKPKG